MNPETQKIPVSFELEIQAQPGEQWEFVRYQEHCGVVNKERTFQEQHGTIVLRRVELLETECEWRKVGAVIANGELARYISINEYRIVYVDGSNTPAQLRDAAKIVEYIETHGALPQTKKREG